MSNYMTDLAKAYYSFFSQFGVPAYVDNNVPNEASLPYLTYTVSYEPDFTDTLIQVKIFSRSSSFVEVMDISDLIANKIANGIFFETPSGRNGWIRKGSPFLQIQPDEDATIKVIFINLVSNII